MALAHLKSKLARIGLATAAAAAVAATLSNAPLAQTGYRGPTHEVSVKIARVRALDQMDVFSKGDFFARVTIAGKSQDTPRARQQNYISPNWTITAAVPAGRQPISIELFDKDLTRDEPIDINALPNKRKQDFSVDTRSCRITGFSGSNRCDVTIVRAGKEKKSAEISFSVSVRK